MNDEKINVKTILVIFILHNEEKLILKKPRLSLIKLNDDNIKAKNKNTIPSSDIINFFLYRFNSFDFRWHIIFIMFCQNSIGNKK